MTNTALAELIIRLENEASQIEMQVEHSKTQRDNYQSLLDEADGRLVSKQELIEFLKAAAEEMAEPQWKKGDRFKWRDSRFDQGIVTDTYNNAVYIRTDGGAQMSMSLDEFDKQVKKL